VISIYFTQSGETPLIISMKNHHIEIASTLVACGALTIPKPDLEKVNKYFYFM